MEPVGKNDPITVESDTTSTVPQKLVVWGVGLDDAAELIDDPAGKIVLPYDYDVGQMREVVEQLTSVSGRRPSPIDYLVVMVPLYDGDRRDSLLEKA